MLSSMRFLVAAVMCAVVSAAIARAAQVKVGTPVDAGGNPALIAIFDDGSYSNSPNRPPSPYTLRAAVFSDGRVVRLGDAGYAEGKIAPEEVNRLTTDALRIASIMPRRDYLYIPPDAAAAAITVSDPTSSELAYRLMLWEPGNYQPATGEQQQFMRAWAGLKGLLDAAAPAETKPLARPVQFSRAPVTTRPIADQETLREWKEPTGVRIVMNGLASIDPAKPTTLIIFAT